MLCIDFLAKTIEKIQAKNFTRLINPHYLTDYYKSKLKPGQDLWWIDQESEKSNNFVINIWNNLSNTEKILYVSRAMILFPEIFSRRQDKYNRFAIWLVKNEGVVCPNVRDAFTAKGRADIFLKNKSYKNVPRIFVNLFENIDSIIKILSNTSAIELTEYWNKKTTERKKIRDWIEIVAVNSKSVEGAKHLNIKQMLTDLIH